MSEAGRQGAILVPPLLLPLPSQVFRPYDIPDKDIKSWHHENLSDLFRYIPAMAWPQTLPDPVTTLMTPGGIPAICDNSANLRAVSGQTWAGLVTTVLPAARQAAIFQESIISG